MTIVFACSQCGKRYSVKDEMAGKAAKCGCGAQLLVPRPSGPPAEPALSPLDEVAMFEKSSAPARPAPTSAASNAPRNAATAKASSPTNDRKERAARLRSNLWRWRKRLLAVFAGWAFLCVATGVAGISYAHAYRIGARRTEMLAQGLGTALSMLLAVVALVVLLIADRAKPPKQ